MKFVLSAFLFSFLLACDDSGISGPQEPLQQATVAAGNNLRFTPSSVEIVAGGTVTWAFGGVAHTVNFSGNQNAPSNIGLNSSAQVSRTFPTPGTYNYACSVHTSPPMTGTVIVR